MNHVAAHSGSWDASPLRGEPPHILGVRVQRNMNAVASSWKREPFENGVAIPFELEIHKRQIGRIEKGLIPEEMEDKWFIYYEKPFLYLHRSWTGQPVYKLEFQESETGYFVKEAQYSYSLLKNQKGELVYQGKLAYFLVCNLLLGKSIPFPKPAGIEEPLPGVYQHHVSGTGYKEEVTESKKKWWQKWF